MGTKHTPGPWSYSEVFDGNDESCGISISTERVEVARIHGVGFVDFDNAKLIAAAPELLAICEAIEAHLQHGAPAKEGHALRKQLQAIVAKATS